MALIPLSDAETGDTDRLDDDRRHGKYYGILSNNDAVVQESGRDAPDRPNNSNNSNNGRTVTSRQITQNEGVDPLKITD